ncbi:MAG: enoyl-CoA hydratase-related protein [Caulobacterales bacterium]
MAAENIDDRILYEKDGAIVRIVLNWPERANAQDSRMVWAFDAALKRAERDYEVKAVILKANGKGFCAGHAVVGAQAELLPEFAENLAATGQHHKAASDLFLNPVLYLWEFRKPIIAQVHGYAVGAGSYWALIPDITICSEDAYFQMPLPQAMGFPTGETMIEPWVFMNYKRAAEYIFQSKTISAQQAFEWGAVNQVVSADKLEETVEAIAANIARAPVTTLMSSKMLIRRAWELMGFRSHMRMSTDLLELATHAEDVRAHGAKMRALAAKPREAIKKRDEG